MPLPPPLERPNNGRVVAIGNFDGVHRGHRAVFAAAISIADRLGARFCVYTFDPAPTAVLVPERHQPRILTLSERKRRILAAGAELVVEPFTREFASGSAAWFVEEILQKRLEARGVVVGPDFCFGRGREGNAALLHRLLPDLEVLTVPPEEAEGAIISSSRIRRLVAAGDVEAATRLMGCPHRLEGVVVAGAQRGRTIGFPTANVENVVELLPLSGVYAVRANVRGALLGGVANIGYRPTFGGQKLSVEVHLFDYSEDIYGEYLTVELLSFIRPEQRFEGIDALLAQIRLDANVARGRLG